MAVVEAKAVIHKQRIALRLGEQLPTGRTVCIPLIRHQEVKPSGNLRHCCKVVPAEEHTEFALSDHLVHLQRHSGVVWCVR